jgi:hypothetical protein
MNHTGICNLCTPNALETPEHTFYTYPAAGGIWDRVKRMREIAGVPTRLTSWWEVLTGIYDPPKQPGVSKITVAQIPGDQSKDQGLPQVVDESPWKVLRVSLLW